MHEDVLDEQRVLVDLVEGEGWDVTETDVSVYESPWEETDAPEATVTITARKAFPDDGDGGESANGASNEREDDGDDSPYRVN
ncbi:MAG: hypothetical protein ABEH88_12580 [Halobacteriales archaeon]